MSIYQGTGLAEGASVTRPPLFDDSMGRDEDMALISRKFMQFLAKKKNSQGRHYNNSSSSRRNNDRSTQPRVENEEVKK